MKITNSIFYIGVDDKNIDLFESQYKVPAGISYNSYLIKDEKNVLMDTVDARKSNEWLKKLDKALSGEKVDYLVISHLEPDHSSNIKTLTEKFPDVTLVGNTKTFEMLPQFFEIDSKIKKHVVKEGDTLNIGAHTLQFFMAPMVHWPEVMVTYEQKEKIVFSADGFGKFGALDLKLDEIEANKICNPKQGLYILDCNSWLDEARRYYINIVGKYGMQVQNLLKKLNTLDIKMICPLHGPILNEKLNFYIEKYNTWSSYEPEEIGTLIAFASIHGNTKKAAYKMEEILKSNGENNTQIIDLARDDIHEAVAQAFKYNKIVLMAASYNMGVFTPMETFLNILKSKNYQNRKVAIIENGSWAPSAGRYMKNEITEMKNIKLIEPLVTIKSAMKDSDIKQMEELAKNLDLK